MKEKAFTNNWYTPCRQFQWVIMVGEKVVLPKFSFRMEATKELHQTSMRDLQQYNISLHYFYDPARWLGVLYGKESFPVLFETMFGNPWLRAQTVEPLFPTNSVQPTLELPFQVGKIWSFTGGPHYAWGSKGSYAAIDFAPASDKQGCVYSAAWVVASAPGLVVRTGTGLVVVESGW